MSKLLKFFAVALFLSADSTIPQSLCASEEPSSNQLDNVEALNGGNFFIACALSGRCIFICPYCSYPFDGGVGQLGNYGGICPSCGEEIIRE